MTHLRKKCKSALKQSIKVLKRLFDFMDIDKEGKVSEGNIIFAMSDIMTKDVDKKDVFIFLSNLD